MATQAPKLLVVDDDRTFAEILARTLQRRGYEPLIAGDVDQALTQTRRELPDYAVVDLRLGEESGLQLVPELLRARPGIRVVVLTGYASISTAVEAIKLGALQYLTKPVEAEEIIRALHKDEPDPDVPIAETPMSVNRLGWEHIQRVLAETDGNISEAARRLGMHRRTLQRKLQKHPPKH